MSTNIGSNINRREPLSLPTRRLKSITTTSPSSENGSCDVAGIESRQESNVHESDFPNNSSEGGNVTKSGGGDDATEADDERRISSPSSKNGADDATVIHSHGMKEERAHEPLRPAFVLEEIGTIDNTHTPTIVAADVEASTVHRHSLTSKSQSPHLHRSQSPQSHTGGSGLVVSRRGRSRSPVGLTPHPLQRSGSNGRHSTLPPAPPTAKLASPPSPAGRELSDAAHAAGEAAAWNNTNGGGSGGAYHQPLSRGGRSPSPVSRLPSLNSHSFSFGNLSPSGEENDGIMEGDKDGCGNGRPGILLGSFDWNVSPDSSPQKHYAKEPQEQYYGQHPDGEQGGGYHHHFDYNSDQRSPATVPYHHQYGQHGETRHHHRSNNNDTHEQYCNQNSSGGDGRYYHYPPSYSPNRPSSNNRHNHEWHHQPNPCNSLSQHRDRGRGHSPIPLDNFERHRRCDVQPQHHHHRNHHRDGDGGHIGHGHHSRSSSPSQRQQALFPEHHIMSGHSENNHHRCRSPPPAAILHYSEGVQRGTSPTAEGLVLQGRFHQLHQHVGREGTSSPVRKSSRSINGGAQEKRKNNNAAHRSSVFRGSPTTRDNLPRELLLALEEDDDEEDNQECTKNSPKNSKINDPTTSDSSLPTVTNAFPSASLNNTMLVTNNSMLALDPGQIDDACLLQDPMLADDDYLNDANLSFRKSYDLEQMFSFIKDGSVAPHGSNNGGDIIQGQLSFNLGFMNSKSEDSEEKKTNSNSKLCKSGDRGTHKRRGSRGDNYTAKNDLLLPCDSSQSMEGLTPINSFNITGEDNSDNKHSGLMESGLVPLNSMDGMALRAFFSSSPNTSTTPPTNAPVVHGNTPPFNAQQGHSHCQRSSGNSTYCKMNQNDYNGLSAGSHNNKGYQHPQMNNSPDHRGAEGAAINKGFPSKRIKLSTRHSLDPIAKDLLNRTDGDYFVLLKKLAPCFAGFRFKLPEMESCYDSCSRVSGSVKMVLEESGITRSLHDSARNSRDHGTTLVNHDHLSFAHLNDPQMIVAMRRISSSICAFGGSLPPRTVPPFSISVSMSSISSPNSIHSPSTARTADDANVMVPTLKEETAAEKEERAYYGQNLSTRYFMKEHCISWDVEVHEVISPLVTSAVEEKVGVTGTPKSSSNKQIGVFKKGHMPTLNLKYCAPVTPHTPSSSPGSSGDVSAPSTPGQSTSGKGTKVKYRCKLCGQPKQNHSCPYESSVVRSIGTMVYPAVNAFVSDEPGRLAPALSEMNNFTSLLSHETSMAGGNQVGSFSGGGGPGLAAGPYRHYQLNLHRGGGPHAGKLLTPDSANWSPNTPGGLSTMSSVDPNSPGAPPLGTPGGPTSNMINARFQGGNAQRRDYNHPMMSRTMTRTMSTPLQPSQPVPLAQSMPMERAGALSSDVLFRDTMELKREQFRAVRPSSANTSSDGSVFGSSHTTIDSPSAYRYPAIPTPYSQRKEMGDTLFTLSREVPTLADSCAAILRNARENGEKDAWDQAVAELTTQVIIVLKCEERDYTLDGLRRHLLTLGIAS
jgi:hypothetical protein